ncbi:MAG: hypothetical protein AAGH89_14520 [Verrucomicrobiota bacterium]
MRLGCFGIFIAIAMLWGGGQMTYVGITNREPTEVSIDELIKIKPSAKWLKVTDGRIDFLNCVYQESITGEPKELYIPIVSKESDDEEVHVIYHTEEADYFETFKKLQAIGNDEELSEGEAILKIAEMSEKLFEEKDVMGLVEFGIDSDSGDDEARGLFENLAEGAIMIEAGEKPSLGAGIALLVVGLGISAFMVRGMLSRESE